VFIDLPADAGEQPPGASLRQRCFTLLRTGRKAESSSRRRGGFNTVAEARGIGEGAYAPHQIVWRRWPLLPLLPLLPLPN
jgi:hypothetical protein